MEQVEPLSGKLQARATQAVWSGAAWLDAVEIAGRAGGDATMAERLADWEA